jgi:cytochrome c oxidase subunit 4
MAHDPHHTAQAHDDHHGVGHVVHPRILILTGLALLVLTVVTVALAGVDFGRANIYVALAIAALKASLVVLFFMHLRWDRPFNAIVFVASLFLVALFIGGAMNDVFEYRGEIIQGDAPKVQQALQALPEGPAGGDHDGEVASETAPAEHGAPAGH